MIRAATLVRCSTRSSRPRHVPGWLLVLVAVTAFVPTGRLRSAEPELALSPELAAIYSAGVPATVEDLRMMDAYQQALVKRITRPTVALRIGSTYGSGVIVSRDGYVLTAAHVAGLPDQVVRVYLSDGQTVYGKTLGMNKGIDAGLIKLDPVSRDGQPMDWPFAEMGDAAALAPGSWCLALGHCGGFQDGRPPVPRIGRVRVNTARVIETDCKLVGGDSGGPLFDMEGKVIGIHSRIGTERNLHIPVDAYLHDWDKMASGNSWGSLLDVLAPPPPREPPERAVIGVRGVDDDPPRIHYVDAASPAERAGLKPGDLVIRFGGKSVDKFATLGQLVRQRQPGDEVVMEIVREGEILKVPVVLGARRGE